MAEFTPRQLKELSMTAKHIGRAMNSMSRANVDTSVVVFDEQLVAIYDAERALQEASNRLLDALDADDEADDFG